MYTNKIKTNILRYMLKSENTLMQKSSMLSDTDNDDDDDDDDDDDGYFEV